MLGTPSRTGHVFAVAARRRGVIHRDDLLALGVDRSWLHRKVASGELRRVFPRVWACGPGAVHLDDEALCMAAVLHAGPCAAVSHVTAAALLGVWTRTGSGRIHVSSRAARRRSTAHRVVFHHAPCLDARDIVDVAGMPTTSIHRTLVDLGTTCTSHQVASVLDQAAFRRMLDVDVLSTSLDATPRRPGNGVVRTALLLHHSGSVGTRSWTEDTYLEAILAAGLPMPVVNTRGTIPGFLHEPDFVWHDQRLVIEIDGPGHDKPGQARIDAALDARLRDAGWRVLRLRDHEVRRDVARCVRMTRELLRA